MHEPKDMVKMILAAYFLIEGSLWVFTNDTVDGNQKSGEKTSGGW